MLLGDLPQTVSLLNRVEDRIAADFRLDLGDSKRVADGDNGLFENALIGDVALEYGLVTLDLDVDPFCSQPVRIELLLQILRRGRCVLISDTDCLTKSNSPIGALLNWPNDR